MNRCVRPISMALVLGAVVGTASLAATFRSMSVDDLIHESEAAARVRVVAVEPSYRDARGMIQTVARLEVVQSLRGALPETLAVRVPGGEVGGYRLDVEGMPEFREGHELLVFLTRWEDGAFKVLGYQQGLSEIRPVNGRERLFGGAAHGRDLAVLSGEIRSGGARRADLKPVR